MKLNLSDEKLKDSLKDNKELLVVISVFGASIGLFLIFILPGILNFPSKMNDRNMEIEKLNQIKQAKSVLEATNKNQLEEDTDLATRALPSDRNFELILGAISEAATRSNAIIVGYKFSASSNSVEVVQGQFPGLIFEIEMAGGVDQAAGFSDQLSIAFPVSEVQEITYERGVSTVIVSFYYKPFTEVNAEDVALARQRTEGEIKALEEISGWNRFVIDPVIFEQVSSESASPF